MNKITTPYPFVESSKDIRVACLKIKLGGMTPGPLHQASKGGWLWHDYAKAGAN